MEENSSTQAAGAGSTGSASTDLENGNVNKDIPLVFLRESEIFGNRRPERPEWVQHVELFKAIGNRIEASHISGLQRVKGMWRIYLDNLEDKVKLMAEGVPMRGKILPVLNTNPDRLDGEQTTKIRIKNTPLSADDAIIKRVITLKGADVISLFREKLRVDNKLTNCETGDRLVIVKTSSLKEPLPNFMTFGIFMGRVFHIGQPKNTMNKPLKCTKCLQDGHTFANCANDWICTVCKMSGHKRTDCPGVLDSPDEADSSESEASEEESETEVPVSSEPSKTEQSSVDKITPGKKSSERRKVVVDRNKRQQSIDRFVTPGKSNIVNNKDRSPPTPTEDLHDKSTQSKNKRKKSKSK